MKSSAAIAFMALASFATATAASAYSLSPPDITSKLRGTVTFTPQGGQPYKCKVTLSLHTKGYIKSVTIDSSGSGCPGMKFLGLPWTVGIESASTGLIRPFDFDGGKGNCDQNVDQFQVSSSGVWTFPTGQCMSGTLTSHPSVTIAP